MSARRVVGIAAAALGLAAPRLAAQSETYQQMETFSFLVNQIRRSYVRPVNVTELVHAAIGGMLRSLDPFSRFVPRVENDRWLEWEAGRLAGTGIILENEGGAVSVAAVMPGSPAARVGILPGDRLVALDDSLVAGVPLSDLQDRLLGAKGHRVLLRLARGPRLAPDTVSVAVGNDVLLPRSVTLAQPLGAGVGYLRLAEFQAKAGQEVHDAVARMIEHQHVSRLILDLRGNPGGFVPAAVDVASEFLPKGSVVFRTVGRNAVVLDVDTTTEDGAFRDVPLALLIDSHTASAAEALSGALQDHDRAEIFGQRSFGKALEQRLYELPPNGDAAWLTVGYIYSPSGRLIQRRYRGLTPEQYFALAGHPGAAQDTLGTYHTDGGRVVRGGGGIEPDSALPAPPVAPLWWVVAADSGFDDAVADSVAATLDINNGGWWYDAAAQWRTRLLDPFLALVRSRLHVAAKPDSAEAAAMALVLARRAAEVRWGTDFAEGLALHNDPEVRAAETWLERPGVGPSVAPH